MLWRVQQIGARKVKGPFPRGASARPGISLFLAVFVLSGPPVLNGALGDTCVVARRPIMGRGIGHRLGDMKALHVVTGEFVEDIMNLGAFDAFSQGLDAEMASHRQDRSEGGVLRGIVG